MSRLLACDAPLRDASGLSQLRPGGRREGHGVLDKAINALGGKEKLAKAEAATWKAKGKITSRATRTR